MRGNQENRVWLLRINQVWGDVNVGVVEPLILITTREKLNSEVIHSFPSCKVPLEVLGGRSVYPGSLGQMKRWIPLLSMKVWWLAWLYLLLSYGPNGVFLNPKQDTQCSSEIGDQSCSHAWCDKNGPHRSASSLWDCCSFCQHVTLCPRPGLVLLTVVFQDPEVVFPHWNLQLLWYLPSRVSYSQSPMRQALLLALLYG